MKYKLKNKNILTNIILCLILIISIVLAFASTFYMKSLATDTKLNSTSVIKTDKNIVRSSKIDNYISSLENESLVEEINIKKEITSVLTIKDNKYQSKIFNYEKSVGNLIVGICNTYYGICSIFCHSYQCVRIGYW